MGKRSRQHQQEPASAPNYNALSFGSMDIARAALEKKKQKQDETTNDDTVVVPAAAVRRSVVASTLSDLEAVYAVTLDAGSRLVVVHVAEAAEASALVASLKTLKVDSLALHGKTVLSQAKAWCKRGGRALVVCDKMLATTFPKLDLKKREAVAVHLGSGSSNYHSRRERSCAAVTKLVEVVVAGKASSPALAKVADVARRRCAAASSLSSAQQSSDLNRVADARAGLAVALSDSGEGKKTVRRKLLALGMIASDVAARADDGAAMREMALTRWLDDGRVEMVTADRCWRSGGLRTGASACCASRQIRSRVFEAKLAPGWSPNPFGEEEEQWGGKFGKACGHNEVVMHCLRPFAPMEVLNTRVCSRAAPAPGNAKFDGCLEFLTSQCKRKRRAVTVWDCERFIFISPKGEVDSLTKTDLMRKMSVTHLELIMPKLRTFTVDCGGRASAQSLLALIETLISLAKNGRLQRKQGAPLLNRKSTRLVCDFLLGPCADFPSLPAAALPQF